MKIKCLLITLLLFSFKGNKLNALRCYVCSDDGSLPCSNFDSHLDKFIQQCDRSQKACRLKTEGNNKTRTCEAEKIDDCKMANGVEYCFCTSDLCNLNSNKFDITDDEDFIEGSGTDIHKETSNREQNNTNVKQRQNESVIYVNSSSNTGTFYINLALFFSFLLFLFQ